MSKFVSLSEYIAKEQVECLNEDPDYPVRNVFTSDPTRFLQSDIDPQLLISVPFRVPVKLGALKLSFREGIDKSCIPSSVKIFTNRNSSGFIDVESLNPVQTISREELLSGNEIPLRFVLFQNILSVQLFVEDNAGSDKTEIGEVEFFGMQAENMDMKEFKKVTDDE